jgi:hypothetical protein
MAGLILSDPAFVPVPRTGSLHAEPDGASVAPHPSAQSAIRYSIGLELLCRYLVGPIDALLRRVYGVWEFSDRPQCLLRIAAARVRFGVWFTDGLLVLPGSRILELHLWNEHLPSVLSGATGLGRGIALRRHLVASLAELADYLDREPSLRGVIALRACAALVPRSRLDKLLRIACLLGFEPAASVGRTQRRRRLSGFGGAILRCAFARAFNPAALRRNGFRRQPCDLWISRSALRLRYGRGGQADAGTGDIGSCLKAGATGRSPIGREVSATAIEITWH